MMPLRVAVIGCGKITDLHMAALRRIPSATVVGVCDRELLMAEQFAERYAVPYASADAVAMLLHVKPDVVHITTPPASHYSLALECIDAGCHVYVEKPFTLHASEAEQLVRAAERRAVLVTAGHNLQYTWEHMAARALVRDGYLGGAPVHIESYYTYNFGDANYARALLGDRQHWVRRLPGGLLHNIISHGIARIAEFVDTETMTVAATGHVSPLLQRIGETDIVDELRVHMYDGRNTTATFSFSSQFAPPRNGFRLYGSQNSLVVDNIHHTIVREPKRGYKSYANYVIPPVLAAFEQLRNTRINLGRFLRSEFHDDSGLKNYIEAFYRAIANEGPLPSSYREIVLTARIMDSIFSQLTAQRDAAKQAAAAAVGTPTNIGA
jgi:predicted dehydrogenase